MEKSAATMLSPSAESGGTHKAGSAVSADETKPKSAAVGHAASGTGGGRDTSKKNRFATLETDSDDVEELNPGSFAAPEELAGETQAETDDRGTARCPGHGASTKGLRKKKKRITKHLKEVPRSPSPQPSKVSDLKAKCAGQKTSIETGGDEEAKAAGDVQGGPDPGVQNAANIAAGTGSTDAAVKLSGAQAEFLAVLAVRLNEQNIAKHLRAQESRRLIVATPVDPCPAGKDMLHVEQGDVLHCEAVDGEWGFGTIITPARLAGQRGCFRLEGMRPLAVETLPRRGGDSLECTTGNWKEVERLQVPTPQQRLRQKAVLNRMRAARAAWDASPLAACPRT